MSQHIQAQDNEKRLRAQQALNPLLLANLNMLECYTIVETLWKIGVENAVLCPGSRSAPLSLAFGLQKKIKTTVILDERSAAFFALGQSKKTRKPTALLCTSGTAVANFLPAVVEASQSNIPLLILTADRPPELQGCHSPQTINQTDIFQKFVRWEINLALSEKNIHFFNYLRQTIYHATDRTLNPQPGPVHINIPLKGPLAPALQEGLNDIIQILQSSDFWNFLNPIHPISPQFESLAHYTILEDFKNHERGLIIVGPIEEEDPAHFVKNIQALSKALHWPILSDALNPLRHHTHQLDYLITNYDALLRNESLHPELNPSRILCIGALPTSKILRNWLENSGVPTLAVNSHFDNQDPLHRSLIPIRARLKEFADYVVNMPCTRDLENKAWLEHWAYLEEKSTNHINLQLQSQEQLFEGKISWLLSQHLPENTPIFIATSTPIRDVEYFWQTNNKNFSMYFNRGANGIDGIVSTALGVAQTSNVPTVLLTGDLTLLHDSNGLLIQNEFQGSLTIILINNQGGGIFEHLPISQFEETFERCIATPQNINFKYLAQAHSIPHQIISTWDQFIATIQQLPSQGIRLLEILTNRKADAKERKKLLNSAASLL